jgi:hypothetical protein
MKTPQATMQPPAGTPAPELARPLGVGGDGLLLALFERLRPTMTAAELDHVAGLTQEAAGLVRQMATLCNGLGCLVQHDAAAMGEGAGSAGNFQDGDEVASLLWLLGSVAGHAHALLQVASMAETLAQVRGEQ